MATTIINPAPNTSSTPNWMGALVGVLILLVFGIIFFVYGLPYIRSLRGTGGIQVNLPKSVNVNVQQSKY